MIKFQGDISLECKQWFIKRECRAIFIAMSCFALVISAIIATVAFFTSWTILSFIFLLVFMSITFPFGFKKEIAQRTPNYVAIDEEKVESENETEYTKQQTADVKKVIDFGDWYLFKFYFPDNVRWVICQKDLIVEGSLEEFELMFKDEIIRKTKK